MSTCADWFAEQIDRHPADEDWQADCSEWHRTERATDELRHNLQWQNVLHQIKYPQLYL